MASITENLKQILSARYGRDVRQSIHDSIKEIDGIARTAQNSATSSAQTASAKASEALTASQEAVQKAQEALESAEQAKVYADNAEAVTGVKIATKDRAGLIKGGNNHIAEDGTLMLITETTSTTLPNSHAGRLKIDEIGGVTEQDSTAGNQLFDASNGKNGYYNTSGVFTADATWFACKVNAPSSKVITVSGAKTTNGSVAYAEFDSSNNYLGYSQTFKNCTVTLKDNTSYVYISCPASEKESLMVNAGTTALPYEPYTGGQPAPNPSYPMPIKKSVVSGVKTHGKNLLDCRGLIEIQKNGITLTPVYENEMLKYIEVNGTATARADFTINERTDVTDRNIIFSGISGGSNTTYSMFLAMVGNETTYNSIYNTEKVITIADDIIYYVAKIRVNEGQTVSNLKLYPMIRKVDIADATYEPYTESSHTFSQPIELYGMGGVQDVITEKPIKRRFAKRIFNGSEEWVKSSSYDNRYYVNEVAGSIPYGLGMCDQFTIVQENSNVLNTAFFISNMYHRFTVNAEFATLEEWKAHLAEKPMEVVYELATEVTEALPIEDQIGLNSLATYDGITYVEFIYEGLEPTFKGKYGTSEVGGYTLEALLTARNNALK